MLKKISFVIIINLIFFILVEFSIRFILKFLEYPQVYKISNIDNNRYDFLTGYYNLPNQKEKIIENFYYQGTDRYGFNLDGKRHPNFLESKDDDEIRIFILGGSTVQGRSLKDKLDPISARLEQKLNERISNKKNFFVINAGTTSFISAQELSLIQNRIIYSLKPDAIIVLNGTNDAVELPSKNFYLSNSHQFQRNFQKNINNQSKSFFYFADDILSRNISTYFLLKKIIEKTTGIYLFDEEARKYLAQSKNDLLTEKKEYRYYYNISILSKLSSNQLPILTYLQPQMLPKNFETLSVNDKNIYNKKKKLSPNYFKDKQDFYKRISDNKKKYENLNSENFYFYNISELLSVNKNEESFYSDHVHYTQSSREIISERLFNDLKKIFEIK